MIIIQGNISLAKKLITINRKRNHPLRWSNFVFSFDISNCRLFFNTLTCELFLLEPGEIHDILNTQFKLQESEVLKSNLSIVPTLFNENKTLNELKIILSKFRKPFILNRGYSIFTTLGCNAHCSYCFEKRMPKISMNEEIAFETVKFIQNTSKREKIRLHWFGGEPLVNVKIIDLISSELRKLGIEFKSDMISNGYLFDEGTIHRAVELWNLNKIQITLDGTEEVYNQTKAFVNAKGSPYRRVLDNIKLLLKAGIAVNIRLNVSLEIASDLLRLADELADRLSTYKNFSVYAHLLFEYDENTPEEQQKELIEAYEKLIYKLYELRLYKKKLPESMPLNNCMADSDNSYTILPNGKIGKCEHFGDSNYVGDIWNGVTDEALVAKFKERETHERCKECLFAPTCTLLKMCHINCNDLYIATRKIDLKYSMLAAYRKWKEENKEKEYETEE